ncbi:tetratricopeptide repeat protein (plasmid) [Streptomyces sp. BI20]|uniref:tetratricopeptide repeat protein n=1 Tax=Streptomyces sp. BI20 TaxID=3403460 RepID=UPI003C77274B
MSESPEEPPASSASESLTRAGALRAEGRHEEARVLLVALCRDHPRDARVAARTAWVHDALGLETEAVPYYERALAAGAEGLSAEDRRGCLLGLGSTYRVLGRHLDATRLLTDAVAEFPEDNALKTFLAMALHHTGRPGEATAMLLALLAETSSDPAIRDYRRALAYYAEHLDETG